jgi:hypothetical protein
MRKLEIYNPKKTYMFPNGSIATPEVVAQKYPALFSFKHIIETDEGRELFAAIMPYSRMCGEHGLDLNNPVDENIAALEIILNREPEPLPPDPQERIAAAMELQAMLALPDNEEITE